MRGVWPVISLTYLTFHGGLRRAMKSNDMPAPVLPGRSWSMPRRSAAVI